MKTKRDQPLVTYMTSEEKATTIKRAESVGLNVAAYLRQLALRDARQPVGAGSQESGS